MTRDEFIVKLAEQYRRVLAGAADERTFGRALERARLTTEEMAVVVRLTRGFNQEGE